MHIRAWPISILLLAALAPSADAVAPPSYNCSPGFGGGLYCWIWAGNGCESEIYIPPTPLYPGPGDATPRAFLYGCGGVSCYTDVEHGGEMCVASPTDTCTLVVRTGALPTDPRFGESLPGADASSCALT